MKKSKKANPSSRAKLTTGQRKVVMVSGGFDPMHIGHVRLFEEAKKLGDELIVVLNNDHWLTLKKGYAFMSQADRKEIILSVGAVDKVLITKHKKNTADISVCKEIEMLRPDVFANGGDRKYDNIPEYELCRRLGIAMAFNVGKGGKVRSSSELVKRSIKKHKSIKK